MLEQERMVFGLRITYRAMVFIISILIVSLLTAPALSAGLEGSSRDYYLILVIDAAAPAARGWAEPIIITHDRSAKSIIADSLDCNSIYTIAGKKVKLGDVYALGGEQMVLSVVNVQFGLQIRKFAKTTYSGLNSIAKIMGRTLDVSAMKAASRSNDRSIVRKEQLKFIDAVANGLHNLTIGKLFSLFSAAFKYVDSNMNLWEVFNLARDLIGGTFIPSDGRNLSFQL